MTPLTHFGKLAQSVAMRESPTGWTMGRRLAGVNAGNGKFRDEPTVGMAGQREISVAQGRGGRSSGVGRRALCLHLGDDQFQFFLLLGDALIGALDFLVKTLQRGAGRFFPGTAGVKFPLEVRDPLKQSDALRFGAYRIG